MAATEDSIDRKLSTLLEEARLSAAAIRAAGEAADAVADLIKRVPPQWVAPEAASGFVRDLGLGTEKLAFTFRPPEVVRIAGSHATGAVARPDVAADLLVRLPKECFHEKDFLNHQYHAKRCLYLCVVAKSLSSSPLVRKVSWSTFQDEARKPVLHVYPATEIAELPGFYVTIIPTASSLFNVSRMNLSTRNNVRAYTKDGINLPTPKYNSSILEDMFLEENAEFISSTFADWKSLQEALVLLKVWARQRTSVYTHDCLNGYLISTILVFLTMDCGGSIINRSMTTRQIFRVVINFLATSKMWAKGLVIQPMKKRTITKEDIAHFLKTFDVAICDVSGHVNLAFRMTKSAFLELQDEAACTCNCLDKCRGGGFEELFMTKVDFGAKFDSCLRINLKGHSKLTASGFCLDDESWRVLEKDVQSLLQQGLTDRTKMIRVLWRSTPSEWNIMDVCNVSVNDHFFFWNYADPVSSSGTLFEAFDTLAKNSPRAHAPPRSNTLGFVSPPHPAAHHLAPPMAQRWRSRARRDPDLDDGESPRQRRAPISDDDEEAGNEDLSLEIVARARRRDEAGGRSGFYDLLSLSSSEEVDEDAVVELLEADHRRKQKKKRRKAKKKQRKEAPEAADATDKEEPQVGGTQEGQTGTAESALTEDGVDVPVSDNIVLRKLLRGPRYFDPGETMLETCFNCCEEGHVAANCPMEKRKKPCFVCGLFGHNAKQCTQGQDCFICKKEGHKAKDCPEKHKRNTQQSITLCLRCGETGHDMFGCANDYPPDDVKEIKCYVCKQNGHLCCAGFSDNCPKEVTCYNCAQSGHIGLGCAKRRENSAATNPTKCFKCGEEGHIAKGCTKNAKSDRFKGEWSAHRRNKDKGKNDLGTRSAPHDAGKTSKRKAPLFEERRDASRGKSRARGGWIVDDPDDLTFMKYKSNGWASPSTPKKPYISHQYSSGGDYSTPQSSRGQKHGFASRSSNYLSNTRKHGFSSSRYADNTNVRSGRS